MVFKQTAVEYDDLLASSSATKHNSFLRVCLTFVLDLIVLASLHFINDYGPSPCCETPFVFFFVFYFCVDFNCFGLFV